MATAAAALLILTASVDPSVALHCPAPAGDALACIAIMSTGWGLSPLGDSGKPDRAPAIPGN